MRPKNIAIFASGTGSNARKIIEYFSDRPSINVSLVICNKPGAGVLHVAHEYGVPAQLVRQTELYESNYIEDILQKYQIDFIVLAGFLLKIPDFLIHRYNNRIINIHPALLPRYGGKGMYGRFVHEAVKAQGDVETGITIHLVNEHYDEGRVLFQAVCPVPATDSAEDIARKVQQLEHQYFPMVIEKFVNGEL